MKLIDMLVEELPKRGGWPEKVTHIGQDFDRELMFYGRGNVRSGIFLDQLAADHRKHGEKGTKITREQYEAALAAKNEGWIDWGGGECPVPRDALVEVKFPNGITSRDAQPAGSYRWTLRNCVTDIAAYRLHQPQEVEQAEADDEADLNERIGQDSAPVWSGEGLPPVGEKVIFFINPRFDYATQGMPAEGREIEVVAHKKTSDGNDVAVCYWDENGGGRAVCLVPESLMPAKSEADRKRDEAVKAIMLTGWCQTAAEEIYDLIAAGKVPGVKLED